jgi:hypothetical protein
MIALPLLIVLPLLLRTDERIHRRSIIPAPVRVSSAVTLVSVSAGTSLRSAGATLASAGTTLASTGVALSSAGAALPSSATRL